jgi:hypothetical protein
MHLVMKRSPTFWTVIVFCGSKVFGQNMLAKTEITQFYALQIEKQEFFNLIVTIN